MTNAERPPIPSELRRQVLVEAGHRCAIPTCRHIDVDVHHIIPWEKCKEHKYENLIALCPNCHNRADRGDIDRKSLRLYKDNLRFAVEKYSQFEMDLLFELSKLDHGSRIPFPMYLVSLIRRILDAGLVLIIENRTGIYNGRVKMTPDWLLLTAKGREFIESLGTQEVGY